jgi:Family of unknown function (DUF5681)
MSVADEETVNGAEYTAGFRRPPLHTRFKPGVSGNPSGRPKQSKNFKTLLNAILNEQISLQEGSQSRKISKAAIMRRLIIGALKGDPRDLHALFRLAEQTGQFSPEQRNNRLSRSCVSLGSSRRRSSKRSSTRSLPAGRTTGTHDGSSSRQSDRVLARR